MHRLPNHLDLSNNTSHICNTIHCMSNSIGVFIVTKEDLKRCTYDTYEDELLKMNILGKKHCVISEDKKSNVF